MKTKISISSSTKIFLISFVIFSLFSCQPSVPTKEVDTKPYVVKSIEEFEFKLGLCVYKLKADIDNTSFIDYISVVDSIGKFNIGDSVVFSLNQQ